MPRIVVFSYIKKHETSAILTLPLNYFYRIWNFCFVYSWQS